MDQQGVPQVGQSSEAENSQSQAPSSSKRPIYIGFVALVFLILGFAGGAWYILSTRDTTVAVQSESKTSLQSQTSEEKDKKIYDSAGERKDSSGQKWKKYKAEFCSIVFEYPTDWKIDDKTYDCDITIQDVKDVKHKFSIDGDYLKEELMFGTNSATQIFAGLKTLHPSAVDITVSGEKGIEYIPETSLIYKYKTAYFSKNDVLFTLHYDYYSTDSAALSRFTTTRDSIAFVGDTAESFSGRDLTVPQDLAENTERRSDINAILNAVQQYAADNKGEFPIGFPSSPRPISSSDINLCASVVPIYLAALPIDPTVKPQSHVTDCKLSYDTGYQISKNPQNNQITVIAPYAELGEIISVTR